MSKRLTAVLLVLAVVVFTAATNSEGYNTLLAAPTELTVNNAGDSLIIGATPLANREVRTRGNPIVYVRVDFSGAAADTLIVYCNFWLKSGATWTYLGTAQATVTAGAVVDATGDNVGQSLALFDTGAANYVEVRGPAASAGTFDLTVWCGASDSSGR